MVEAEAEAEAAEPLVELDEPVVITPPFAELADAEEEMEPMLEAPVAVADVCELTAATLLEMLLRRAAALPVALAVERAEVVD